MPSRSDANEPVLARVLGLPLLVLYGLGVTVGAGIYVLIGATAGRAGSYAPMAFVLAAVAMGFSAASFAELSSRFPVSAGEAAYVRHGWNSRRLALFTGMLVALSGVVSSAAITIGGVGYLQEFIPWSDSVLIVAVLLILGGTAAWGILESVTFAAVFTVVELFGLLAIIVAGFYQHPNLLSELPSVLPAPTDWSAMSAIAATSLLAFFAFIGFEDLVNLAEEARNPAHDMPRAIFITLVVATLLYVLVVFVAVNAVSQGELAASTAPLSLVFERLTGASAVVITLVAIVATFNGVIVQIIMASRVLYGLSVQGDLPAWLSVVHPRSRTPLRATALVLAIILGLALFLPLGKLAEWTSQVVLTVFILVNASLWRLKVSDTPLPAMPFEVRAWVPAVGVLLSSLLLLAGFFLE